MLTVGGVIGEDDADGRQSGCVYIGAIRNLNKVFLVRTPISSSSRTTGTKAKTQAAISIAPARDGGSYPPKASWGDLLKPVETLDVGHRDASQYGNLC
jgi:hypothetical protein